MRLASKFIVLTALIASGSAFSASTEFKATAISSTDATLDSTPVHGVRRLRTDETKRETRKESQEERGVWIALKSFFTGTDYEINMIKQNAHQFSEWNNNGKMPYDVYRRWIHGGHSHMNAMKWGARFEQYQKNPSAFH